MIVDTPTRVLLETLKVNMHADLRGELQKIGVPTLIVHDMLNADILAFIHGRPLPGPPQLARSQG